VFLHSYHNRVTSRPSIITCAYGSLAIQRCTIKGRKNADAQTDYITSSPESSNAMLLRAYLRHIRTQCYAAQAYGYCVPRDNPGAQMIFTHHEGTQTAWNRSMPSTKTGEVIRFCLCHYAQLHLIRKDPRDISICWLRQQ